MITFKCKMCGGDLSFEPGASVAECPYCGTTQTLPKLDDDRRANLYDRANHFRRQNEYDKAMAIYEQILQEDRADAEAYWSLVLCRYGIEYVEDPATRKRVPTVNRVQYASILADEDYKSALNYADATQRGIYEAEANAIAEIQRGILDISKQEEPFDVFICYKETDEGGRRTPDSVLATDLYHQLTKEGFKVFFARITLEDKIGTAYEPYIFAALNSARVMVVLGTKPEYFNAVWVKNEWSRYLALIRAGADKVLVPAYRDMDPYDLPEEFAHLQAQDMGKLGFMQDLIRGIKKLTAKDEPAPQPATPQVVTAAGANIENLMKRARLFMEDGDWKSAAEYLDKVLDEDAEYAPAYAGKVQAALKLRREEDLAKSLTPYEDSADWKKAVRFAAPAQRNVYEGYVASAVEMREENRKQKIYDGALQTLRNATTIDDCIKAKVQFESIPRFRDSDQKAQACLEKVEQIKYQGVDAKARVLAKTKPSEETAKQWENVSKTFASIHWNDAEQRTQWCLEKAEAVRMEVYDMASRALEGASTPENCKSAMQFFESLGSFRDAKTQIEACQQKKAQLEAEIEAERKAEEARRERERLEAEAKAKAEAAKRRTRNVIALLLIAAITAGTLIYVKVIKPNGIYNSAIAARNAGNYDQATEIFASLGAYKDAATQAQESQYQKGAALLARGDYDGAAAAFKSISGYSDADTQAQESQYQKGVALLASGDYDGAAAAFESITDYRDAATMVMESQYQKASSLASTGNYDEAYQVYDMITNYKDVESIISVDKEIHAAKLRSTYAVGKTLKMGRYKQSSSGSEEDITWIIVANDGQYVTLLSQYALDCIQYNTSDTSVTWETSSIRSWLNNRFYNNAFDSDEALLIKTVIVTADKNPDYNVKNGNDTEDRVFLLSAMEVEKYLPEEKDRKCLATEYAKTRGVRTYTEAGHCDWWLRTMGPPGKESHYAMRVGFGGWIDSRGYFVDYNDKAIRPAIVVKIHD